MSKRRIKIQVSRTIQVDRYEPVTVSIEEEIVVMDDEADDARKELYRSVTQNVKKFIDNERLKYTTKKAKQND